MSDSENESQKLTAETRDEFAGSSGLAVGQDTENESVEACTGVPPMDLRRWAWVPQNHLETNPEKDLPRARCLALNFPRRLRLERATKGGKDFPRRPRVGTARKGKLNWKDDLPRAWVAQFRPAKLTSHNGLAMKFP